MDNKKECFVLDELPYEKSFLTLKLRRAGSNISFFKIFNKFIDDEVMDKLYNEFTNDDLILQRRIVKDTRYNTKKVVGHICMDLKMKNLWIAMAVQIRIIGRGVKSTENNPMKRGMETSVNEAIDHFRSMFGNCPNSKALCKLLSNMFLKEGYGELISKKFVELVLSLGQSVAGDEKLWRFTGNSGNIRLCISKPDKVGFWFYELCAMFSNGLPYMLQLLMHNSTKESVKVVDIVKGWIAIVKEVGSDFVPEGELPNPKTYLACDSYYVATESRSALVESGINFCASVQKDRFANEVKMIHPPGHVPKTGEWRGMYNPRTDERFVYHYDTQKGVGIKYNLSKGFERCLVLNTIKQHSNRIPCYDNYKTFFEACDHFNRNLHDRYFPHKRGGFGRSGEDGEHNDFIMACVLQNTFNAYHHINNANVGSITFKQMCDNLSDDIFIHSMSY